MKTIQEKVKDIVDVRPYRSIGDFAADPAETLSSYRYTDATAELMAKWINAVATSTSEGGTAFALAGYRGVGKSHFLAALGAMAANPDLRQRVTEPHVAFSAEQLMRRQFRVINVRRGTRGTLIEEFADAVIAAVGPVSVNGSEDFRSILQKACDSSPDRPIVVLIDTAIERVSRVTRDDGPSLCHIAEAAKARNVFLGVALDDDIADADGSNSAIVRSFVIDYLDQGHLYKVVDTHIFPKHSQKLGALHETYDYFRRVLPAFRWSEHKFSSLYPLHPAILEVSPFVRLYVHDFALLGFASEAGERILGRPANSLIALDEVFDNSEAGLRKADELAGAFEAYDKLNSEVVNKIPVMKRLQARLVLKAMLLLSLGGQGSTAAEICAAILIFDENDPEAAVSSVGELLATFAKALPEGVRAAESQDGTRYLFKLENKEGLEKALEARLGEVDDKIAERALRRLLSERFTDAGSLGSEEGGGIECSVEWRGSVRRGTIVWRVPVEPGPADWDWAVVIEPAPGDADGPGTTPGVVRWLPDALRPDELNALKSYHLLTSDDDIRGAFSDQVRPALHTLSLTAEKILSRAFLEDGKLVIDGFDFNFTDDARSASRLSQLFGAMLEPWFETRFPDHPYFTEKLCGNQACEVITDLFNDTKRVLPEVQRAAEVYALPLGLVRMEKGSLEPEAAAGLRTHPLISPVLEAVESSEKPVNIAELSAIMHRPPFGLVREARQLILTSLAAQRMVEFITRSGDRISRRSLDLRIDWDDIAAVAPPTDQKFSTEKLEPWGAFFSPNGAFLSLDIDEDRQALLAGFAKWLEAWKRDAVIDRFSALGDAELTVNVWRMSVRVTRSFGAIVEPLQAACEHRMSIEECLKRVAEAFSDSEKELTARAADMRSLSAFVDSAPLRHQAELYLSRVSEYFDEDVAALKNTTLSLLRAAQKSPSEAAARELSYSWDRFLHAYAEKYRRFHAAHSATELPVRGALWELELMISTGMFGESEYRGYQHVECDADLPDMLKLRPFCGCELFRGSADAELGSVRDTLEKCRSAIVFNREKIQSILRRLDSSAAVSLADTLDAGVLPVPLEKDEALALVQAIEMLEQPLMPAMQSAGRPHPFSQAPVEDEVLLNI